ncbi:RNA ligase family protein [Corallococcus exiguus]|uniref:RNA ligase family protein n=1 Tax=Corallococcus exiguus TaxID=83462 RepID=UPI0015611034|nr:RNA ligase family protein [Corallococcus exiguus]NRD48327.1 RNA ligase [Corallococcus exiguus]
MRFRPFLKMSSAGDARGQASPSGSWVALEKLHGAQLVLGVQDGAVHFGKRKAWLEDGDSFFGWQLLRLSLSNAALEAVRTLGLTEARVYLYGELLGGRYPHPEVPAVPGMMPVQTGIWYAPGLHWVLFDILVARSDEDEGVMLSHRDVETAARAAGVLVPPLVARGTRAQMEAAPTRALTRLPAMLGLPPLADNHAEGLVIKSEQPVSPGQRVAFKRKIEEFNEARFDESTAWDAHQRLSFTELQDWSSRLVNPARIASALSKCGRDNAEAVLSEVELDVRVDLELAFPTACQSLDPASEERLSAHVRELSRPRIREALDVALKSE